MGGRAVGVALGELACMLDAFGDFASAKPAPFQVRKRDATGRAYQAAVGEVGENAQKDGAAGELFDARSDALGHCIDEVGAHGVDRVDMKMRSEERRVGKECGAGWLSCD